MLFMDASMSLDQSTSPPRRLAELPTPCLVLDRGKLARNLATMAEAVGRHGVPLRPHMKTAKSAESARMAVAGQQGGITVSTLAEVEHFAAAGFRDILYAVGITPAKLDRAAALRRAGVDLTIVTDDDDTAAAIAAHARATGADHRVLVEVDCGEHRIVIDAGAMALSKDRSTAAGPRDYGFGLVLDVAGRRNLGEAIVERANQEHGIVASSARLPFERLPVGAHVRVAPNHVCMTAAAYDRYHVVDGDDAVIAVWERVNGW